MSKNKASVFLITEDFPSGLNGTSVKTRNTLDFLLKNNFHVDVCCFHFENFNLHQLKHPNLKIYKVKTKKKNKRSFNYLLYIFQLVTSFVPITIKRLYQNELAKKINSLCEKNKYDVIFYDGYSTLQYFLPKESGEQIYIDDEDFTDLFRQRFLMEKNTFKKLFYGVEFLKSLIFERFTMRKVSQIWAISPNTKERLQKVSGKKTVLMPTIISAQENLYQNLGKNIVFTGTLNWPENVDGLKWFIEFCWDEVLSLVPRATLTVIGQGASPEFAEYLKKQRNVTYLGYTPDLREEYKKSTLAISPVRINAGIKVKTLTYLSYGLPVVSSEIASWGLVSTGGVLVVKDGRFPLAIAALLMKPKVRRLLSKQGFKNIKINYKEQLLGEFLQKNLNIHE